MPSSLLWELSLSSPIPHPQLPAPLFRDCSGSLEVVECIACGTLTIRRLHLHSLAEVIHTRGELYGDGAGFFLGGGVTYSTLKEGQ